MTHHLPVATQEGLVGQVGFESGNEQFSFDYDRIWREREGGFPLSPHISLTSAPAFWLGATLSGELAAGRPRIGNRFRHEPVVQGKHLWADRCSRKGACWCTELSSIRCRDSPVRHSFDTSAERRIISNEELKRIRERDQIPFPVWDKRVRLSIAGYQDKRKR